MAGTVLLHLGPHRTGSTYLQQSFSRARGQLRSQGVEYPAAGAEFASGHHNLAWLIRGRALRNTNEQALRADVARLVASPSRLLLSSEEFAAVGSEEFAELRKMFEGYVFAPIYVRRTGARHVASLWQNMVQHGATLPLDKVSHVTLSSHYRFDPLDHGANIARWEGLTGQSAIVVDYDAALAANEDILIAFGRELGLSVPSPGNVANPSLPIESIELIRAANIYSFSIGRRPRLLVRHAAQDVLRGPGGNEFRRHVIKLVNETSRPLQSQVVASWFRDGDRARASGVSGPLPHYVPGKKLMVALDRTSPQGWLELKRRIEALDADHRDGPVRWGALRRLVQAIRA